MPGKRILLRLSFPSTYPAAPPYVRVIRPRFAFRTGHVTIGGSICTEMLTSAGWSSTMTVESVLVGIRANMIIGGARLDLAKRYDSGIGPSDLSPPKGTTHVLGLSLTLARQAGPNLTLS